MEILDTKKFDNHQIIRKAVTVLKNGGLLIYPTETCYGVGVDATNDEAVNKLIKYKSKRGDKPISIAVTDLMMASDYVEINETAQKIYKNFLPGPVTVISKSKGNVPKFVESSEGTLGIRIPDHELVSEIVKQFGKPITATSANASYKKTPYSIKDVFDHLSDKQKGFIDLVIDEGNLPKRKPSVVLDTTLEDLEVLREGDIDFTGALKYESSSEEDTEKFVNELFQSIENDIGKKLIVFELIGELGAGKTHFTKFLAKKFGVKENVVSPTYIICNEYKAKYREHFFDFYHMDTYRLIESKEIDELTPDMMFQSPNVVVIEWANKVSDYIKKYLNDAIIVKVKILHQGGDNRYIEYKVMNSENS